jgi:tetratricopeptide (TPR) repeat protein
MQQAMELMNEMKFTEAEKLLVEQLRTQPKSVDARIGLSKIRIMERDFDSAQMLIQEAQTLAPENAEAGALAGVLAMQQNAWDQAVDQFNVAAQQNPKLEMIYSNLARTLTKLKRYDESEQAARRAIELNPSNYRAHSELAHVLVIQRKVKEGIHHLIQAIRLNPMYVDGYLRLGELFTITDQVAQAMRIYIEGLRHNKLALPLHRKIAALFALRMDFQSALKEAEFIANQSNSAADWLQVGIYAAAAGKFEQAEAAWKKSLEIQPKQWQAHYNLGELYRVANLNEKAKEQYKLANEFNASAFEPLNGMGVVFLFSEKNVEQAKVCFMRALERAPGRKEPLLNLAIACAYQNDWTAAQKFASDALAASRPTDSVHAQAERLLAEVKQQHN